MQIRDSKPQQAEESTIGGNMERIGNYKVQHDDRRRLVRFFHYRQGAQWQLDEVVPQNDFVVYYSEEGVAHTLVRLLWEDRFIFSFDSVLLLIRTYAEIFQRCWNLRTWDPCRKNKFVFLHCTGVTVIHSTYDHLISGQFCPSK